MFKGMWVSIICLFVLLTSGCVSSVSIPEPKSKTQEEVVQEIGTSTAALVMQRKDKIAVYCTAVWIGSKTLLTAHHCVEGALKTWAKDHKPFDPDADEDDDDDDDSDELELPDVKTFKFNYIVMSEQRGVGNNPSALHSANAVMLDKDHDLAVLKITDKSVPFHTVAKLAKQNPYIGEHVFVRGHVTGLYWTHTECVVSAYRGNVPTRNTVIKGPFVQLSGPVFYGNSGGGAFNKNGELIGIASFMYRAPQTTMFISLDSIKKFLKVQ